MQKENFSWKVEEHLATLNTSESGRYAIELNIVTFRGYPPKLDLRRWDKENSKPLKGISLTDPEAEKLLKALEQYLNRKDA